MNTRTKEKQKTGKPAQKHYPFVLKFEREEDAALFREMAAIFRKRRSSMTSFLVNVAENYVNRSKVEYLTAEEAREMAKRMGVIISVWMFNYERRKTMTEGVEYIRESGQVRGGERFLFAPKPLERFFRAYKKRQKKRGIWRKRYRAVEMHKTERKQAESAKESQVIRVLPEVKKEASTHHAGIQVMKPIEEVVYE